MADVLKCDGSMRLRRVWRLCFASILLVAAPIASPCRAQPPRKGSCTLAKLASARFSNLTRAEQALLEHADVMNIGRAKYAAGGPSSNPDDSSNDPANASQWDSRREIRASLIRWMSVDPDAIMQIDPQGIRVLGAKIIGSLDFSGVHVPFAITLRNCAIPEAMEMAAADIPSVDFDSSYIGSIHANSISVPHWFSLQRVHLAGIIDLQEATIGVIYAAGAYFKYRPEPGYPFAPTRTVLNLTDAHIKGSINLTDGFEVDGGITLNGARIGANLICISGQLFNPENVAINAIGTEIAGYFYLMSAQSASGTALNRGGQAKVNGTLQFSGTRIAGVTVWDAVLSGSAGTPHGFSGRKISASGIFIWRDVTLEDGAQLDLTGASIGTLGDQERSWPAPGNLLIDGLTYSGFSSAPFSPVDADTRLKWLALQPSYHPQPYRQLAKVLRETGDEKGAVRVLVAEGDARYRQMGPPGRVLGTFLKCTIGYGHRPLLALLWSLGVVLLGSVVVMTGKRAGVMRLTWPETTPPPPTEAVAGLHPMLYSLDIFLPFVNLHQEHYWWPDEAASGQCNLAGLEFRVDGWLLRYYLWLQIIAGWLLSAIFVAGVTGLIRSD
jgi:hypothetical protein